MQTINKTKLALLATLCTMIFSFSTLPGGHSYKIYINKKLILEQAVSHGNKTTYLTLSQKNFNDKIDVSYNHCGVTGTARHIVIRDEHNRLLKDWHFADASGSSVMMSFNAKDLITLQTDKAGKLGMYYYSKEMPDAQLLATVVKANNVNVASVSPKAF